MADIVDEYRDATEFGAEAAKLEPKIANAQQRLAALTDKIDRAATLASTETVQSVPAGALTAGAKPGVSGASGGAANVSKAGSRLGSAVRVGGPVLSFGLMGISGLQTATDLLDNQYAGLGKAERAVLIFIGAALSPEVARSIANQILWIPEPPKSEAEVREKIQQWHRRRSMQ